MNIAQRLAQTRIRLEVKRVFGMPGGATLPLLKIAQDVATASCEAVALDEKPTSFLTTVGKAASVLSKNRRL
jgi:hypothetical protein